MAEKKILMFQAAASRIQSAEARKSGTGGVSRHSFAARAVRAAAWNELHRGSNADPTLFLSEQDYDIESNNYDIDYDIESNISSGRGCQKSCCCCCGYLLLLVALAIALVFVWTHYETFSQSPTWNNLVDNWVRFSSEVKSAILSIWNEIVPVFSHWFSIIFGITWKVLVGAIVGILGVIVGILILCIIGAVIEKCKSLSLAAVAAVVIFSFFIALVFVWAHYETFSENPTWKNLLDNWVKILR